MSRIKETGMYGIRGAAESKTPTRPEVKVDPDILPTLALQRQAAEYLESHVVPFLGAFEYGTGNTRVATTRPSEKPQAVKAVLQFNITAHKQESIPYITSDRLEVTAVPEKFLGVTIGIKGVRVADSVEVFQLQQTGDRHSTDLAQQEKFRMAVENLVSKRKERRAQEVREREEREEKAKKFAELKKQENAQRNTTPGIPSRFR